MVDIHEINAKLTQLAKDTKETRQRAQRLETRVTRWLNANGFDTNVNRCEWDEERSAVISPSRDVTLRELVETIPEHRGSKLSRVFVGTDVLALICRA